MTWPREYYQQFELILASSRHTASLPPALPLASSPSLFLTVCLLFLFFLSLSLCSCINLSASLSQSLYTVCYSLAPPPFLPPICIPSLQKRPLKVNVCFHLRSSFSLPVPSCVYLHQTVSQVFPSSYGYPVWLHAHLFIFFNSTPSPWVKIPQWRKGEGRKRRNRRKIWHSRCNHSNTHSHSRKTT